MKLRNAMLLLLFSLTCTCPAPAQERPARRGEQRNEESQKEKEELEDKVSVTQHTATIDGKEILSGVNLVVNIDGGRAWLKVWVDGKLDPTLGAAGSVIGNGKTLTFTGQESVEVRSGSSGVTKFTLNGTPLGALGRPGIPETWLFKPPDPPVKTDRR